MTTMKTLIAILVLSTAAFAGDTKPAPPPAGTTLKGLDLNNVISSVG
jgi:hypothetical protein